MNASLWVLAGSALGGLARYWVGIGMAAVMGPRLPWGTLLINVAGSLAIGWFAAAAARLQSSPDMRLFVMVGLCGGFTTFSSFSLQTIELLRAEAIGWAAAYVAASVVLCVGAAGVGFVAGR